MSDLAAATVLLVVMKTSLVIGIAWLLTRALTRVRAGLRHALWTGALVLALLLPLVSMAPWSLELPVLPEGSATPALDVSLAPGSPAGEAAPALDRPTGSSPATSGDGVPGGLVWPVALYVAGVSIVLSRAALGHHRAWRLTRASRTLASGSPWSADLRALGGIARRNARFRLAPGVRTPLTVGVLRPMVLLPSRVSGWTAAGRRRALVHELAHVRRCDTLTLLVTQLACGVHWFNPLVWIAARHVRLEAEIACDAHVLASSDAAGPSYAQQLVDLARITAPRSAATIAMTGGSDIGRRIAVMLSPTPSRPAPVRARIAIASCAALAALVAPLSVGPADADRPPTEREWFRTPLTRAAAAGDLAEVTRLVTRGAEVDAAPKGDATALMEAAERGHREIVAFLIEAGADVNVRLDGDGTPLIAAAGSHDTATARLLLAAGADANVGVEGDANPLIVAVRSGDVAMVALLLEAGADPTSYVPGDETAIVAAHEAGSIEILELLLDAARE